MKVTKELGRNSWGYEIDLELKSVVLEKTGFGQTTLTGDKETVEVIEKSEGKRPRMFLQRRVRKQRSATKKTNPERR